MTGQVRLDAVLVNARRRTSIFGITGEETQNPADGAGQPGFQHRHSRARVTAGLQVWDTHEILMMHLTQLPE